MPLHPHNDGTIDVAIGKTMLTLWLISVLAACQSSDSQQPKPAGRNDLPLPVLTPSQTHIKDHGVLVARVIDAGHFPLPFNQLTITPKRYNSHPGVKMQWLKAKVTDTANGTVFASHVRAGDYSLRDIRSFLHWGYVGNWIMGPEQFGSFTVKAGQVTDLGTLIYYPKPNEDRFTRTLLRRPVTPPGDTLSKHFAFYRFDPAQISSWSPASWREDEHIEYYSAAQNPVYYNDVYSAANGNTYFVGKLGMILIRASDGQWLMDSIDTDLELNSITLNTQGDMAAAGNEGVLYLKRAGQSWQLLPFDHHDAISEIRFDPHNPNRLNIYSFNHQFATQYIIRINNPRVAPNIKARYLLTYDGKGRWAMQGGFSLTAQEQAQQKGKEPFKITRLSVENSHQGMAMTMAIAPVQPSPYSAQQTKNIKFYYHQTANRYIQQLAHPNPLQPAGAVELDFNQDDNHLAIHNQPHWIYLPQTQDWRKLAMTVKVGQSNQAFVFAGKPYFSSATQGVAVVRYVYPQTSAKLILVYTDDSGQSWHRSPGRLPATTCTEFVGEFKPHLLLSCQGVSSDFYESTDRGLSWQHVRQHSNY